MLSLVRGLDSVVRGRHAAWPIQQIGAYSSGEAPVPVVCAVEVSAHAICKDGCAVLVVEQRVRAHVFKSYLQTARR